MRRFTQQWNAGHLLDMMSNVRRRQGWFTENATPIQMANLLLAGAQFALKNETMKAWPVLVKIDISPLCNLHCTYCVHARPSGDGADLLKEQSFNSHQRMSLEQFRRLVQEIGGKSMAVSLYYIGDPLVHPDVAAMCTLARDAKLNAHISTNFSFNLSDERLARLVTSGLSHLTVCVESFNQELYQRTRVGGRIAAVLDNLERVLKLRRELGQTYPRVEVQFIKFQHNLDELESVAQWCEERGVDQFTDYWGNLHNYTDVAPGRYRVFRPKRNKRLPQCSWPHFSMQVKYNGEAIPCCYHRVADQYREGVDKREVGNVFQTSVWDVWNSLAYRQLRRFVSNPERVASEPSLRGTFCDGCKTIFETDASAHEFMANQHKWEDIYLLDERIVVKRKERQAGQI